MQNSYSDRIHRGVVTAVRTLGPGMIRVTLGGDDMRDYPTTGIGDEYVRVFFPDRGEDEPRMPFLTERGWDFAEGVEPSEMRTYTIRDHRPGEVEIDFVEHNGGIASAWALDARVGQVLALNPPRGLYERPASATRQILIADEPALPAALRIAELTAGIPTELVCEIRDTGYELLPSVPLDRCTWVSGSGNGVRPSRLAETVRRLDLPSDGSVYVWVAGETRVTRDVRRFLRHDRGLPADAYKIVGYWTYEFEEWRARYEALPTELHTRIDELYEREGDSEAVMDEVYRIYESVGL